MFEEIYNEKFIMQQVTKSYLLDEFNFQLLKVINFERIVYVNVGKYTMTHFTQRNFK
jgi:hypothetical protein